MSKLFLLLCLFLSACAATSPSVDNDTASQLNTIQMQNYELQALVVGLDSKLNDIEKRMQQLENNNLPAGKVIPAPNKNSQPASSSNIMANSSTNLAPNFTNTEKNVVEPKGSNSTSTAITPKVAEKQTTTQTSGQTASNTTATSPTGQAATNQTATTQTANQGTTTEAGQTETTASITPTTPTTQAPPAEPKTPTPLNKEQAAYAMALKLYQSGRYVEAEAAFNAFDQSFPTSSLLPNSLYWKGETYYARRDFPQAILIFKEVQTRFPNTEKAADSLLKTALAYDRLGDADNALLNYNALIEDYPNSEALKRAKQLRLVP